MSKTWLIFTGLAVVVVGLVVGLVAIGVVIGLRLSGPQATPQAAVAVAPSPVSTPLVTAPRTPVTTSPAQPPAPPPKAHFTLVQADWPNMISSTCIHQPWDCVAHGLFRNDGSGTGNAQATFTAPPYGATCATVLPLTRPGDVAEASCVFHNPDLGLYMLSHSSDQIQPPKVEISNP